MKTKRFSSPSVNTTPITGSAMMDDLWEHDYLRTNHTGMAVKVMVVVVVVVVVMVLLLLLQLP